MALEWTDLQEYVNDRGTASQAFITRCLDTATDLVTAYIAGHTVPESVLESAILETGSKVFQRRNAPNGTFEDPALGGTTMAPRDPMITAYPLLQQFVKAGL